MADQNKDNTLEALLNSYKELTGRAGLSDQSLQTILECSTMSAAAIFRHKAERLKEALKLTEIIRSYLN